MTTLSIGYGCESYTRPDGSKVAVLSPATTQHIGEIKEVAGVVAAVTPPVSPLHDIAWIVASLAGITITVNELRKKNEGAKLGDIVGALNNTLVRTGLLQSPGPPQNLTDVSSTPDTGRINVP